MTVFLFPLRSTRLLIRIYNLLFRLTNEVDGRVRQLEANRTAKLVPPIRRFDGQGELGKHVLERLPPWKKTATIPSDIPIMISDEEKKYYTYLGKFFRGEGAVIELGPWVGGSTFYILAGLAANTRFVGQKLQVFDAFIWQEPWMEVYLPPNSEINLKQGDNFKFLFDRYVEDFKDNIDVYQRKVLARYGNDHISDLVWDGGPIEMCFIDVGRDFEINEAWYKILCSYFIPGKTLVIMQDWRAYRSVPVMWFNQTKMFTDSKGSQLELIHELRDGGVATFLYHGDQRRP